MPAISFSTMKDKIISGEKKQTIRPLKTDYWLRWEKGDRLVGYWKQRTCECEQLFESEFAEDPFKIKFGDYLNCFGGLETLDYLARKDGFGNDNKMREWFKDKYGPNYMDMDFVVIRWS